MTFKIQVAQVLVEEYMIQQRQDGRQNVSGQDVFTMPTIAQI